MKPLHLIFAPSLCLLLSACSPSEDKTAEAPENTAIDLRPNLSKSLTFHASFDKGPNADFGAGDLKLYSFDEKSKSVVEGMGNAPLKLDTAQGKFNSAIRYTKENSHTVFYKAEKNIEYSREAFAGTFSFWLSTDTDEIPGQYCDPVQITDKDYSNAAIWVDITKNDSPSDLRLGFFGDQPIWDVANKKGEAEEFFWRLHKIAQPPLGKGKWTHVVITWDGVNNTKEGRAKLFVNGEFKGASSAIREPFTWDVANTRLNLGIGYVGMFDDVAVFNKALSPEEVTFLFGLENGVSELRRN